MLISPNCDELITATLAAQAVGQVSAETPTAVLALGPAADCAAVERMAKSFAATCEIEEQ